jgi:integrase
VACGKAHGSWSYSVDAPAVEGERRRQITRGGFPTKQAAEAALAEFLGSAARGEVAVPRRMTVPAYLDAWLIGIRPTLAVAGWTNYRSVINLYVRPRIGNRQVQALTAQLLTALYGELLTAGGKNGKPLSPTTVRLVHRVVSKALEDAVESRILATNPTRHAKVPKRRQPVMRTWTAEQASSFLRAAAEDRLYACWLLALVCGLRRGELAGLRWSELDPAQGALGIVEQRTTDADWNVVTTTPKGTSRRTIDLGPQALAALQAHRRQTEAERREWGRAWTDTGLIFVREDGIGYHPSRITDVFQGLAREAGVPVIRLHDARHSCATLALAAGVHPKVVQQLLGHASWSTTMDLYTHRVERLQRDASARIEGVVFGVPTENS